MWLVTNFIKATLKLLGRCEQFLQYQNKQGVILISKGHLVIFQNTARPVRHTIKYVYKVMGNIDIFSFQ